MTDTASLHIRGGDAGATRVVRLPGTAIRVGRGAVCEVQLADPALAEVQCLLRRRGRTWHVQPIGPAGLVSIAGDPIHQLRPLPEDVPLDVGAFRLLLRGEGVEPEPEPIEVRPRVEPRTAGPAVVEAEADRLRRWEGRLELRERWLQARQDEKKWEARWKAAGEGLRNRAGAPPRPGIGRSPAPTPATPATVAVPEPRGMVALPRSASPPPRSAPDAAPALPRIIEESPATEAEPIASRADEPSDRLLHVLDDGPGAVAEVGGPDSPATVLEPDRPAEGSSLFFEPPTPGVSWHRDPVRPGEGEPAAAGPSRTTPTGADAGFPDAATIFAAQGRRSVPEAGRPASTSRRATVRPEPTDPVEPALWSMPAWVALPPVALGSILLIGVGAMLAATWTKDNLAAGLAARAALRAEEGRPPRLDPTRPVETRWWKTTADHMLLWASAIGRSPEADARADEVREALDSARRASPLHASARFATAEPTEAGAAVGLSRDVVAMTLAGRSLKRAGKVEPALRAYRRALELAADAEPSRLGPPAFDDDPKARRFRLPHEGIVEGVVRDMIEAGGWGFADWSAALPPIAVVRLVVARALREKGSADADRAFGLVLADDVPTPATPGQAAEHLAAQAEALALTGRGAEAAERYRRAIAAAVDDPTRRRWRLALAEILAPLGASRERSEMIEAAKGSDPDDDVTRKALDAQKFAGLK